MNWEKYERAKVIEEKLDKVARDLEGAKSLLNVERLDISFPPRYCRGVELSSVSRKATEACLAICIDDLEKQLEILGKQFEEV